MPIKEGFLEHIVRIHFGAGGPLLVFDVDVGSNGNDSWYSSLRFVDPAGASKQMFGASAFPLVSSYDFSKSVPDHGVFASPVVTATPFTSPAYPGSGTPGWPGTTFYGHKRTLFVNLNKYSKDANGRWNFSITFGSFSSVASFTGCYLSWPISGSWTSHTPADYMTATTNGYYPTFDGGAAISANGSAFGYLVTFASVAAATAYYGVAPGPTTYLLYGPDNYGSMNLTDASFNSANLGTFTPTSTATFKHSPLKFSSVPVASSHIYPPYPVGFVQAGTPWPGGENNWGSPSILPAHNTYPGFSAGTYSFYVDTKNLTLDKGLYRVVI